VYSGVGEVDGDVVFGFEPKDSIQFYSYDYFSSYTPSALSFAYGVLSVDLDQDGVVDARIAFPDLPDETLWLGIETNSCSSLNKKVTCWSSSLCLGFSRRTFCQ
jgi:hypothetical protein